MSAGQTILLSSAYQRMQAKRLIDLAPDNAIVNVKQANRTTDQNALMWALLSSISRAKPDGRTMTPDVWKSLFLHSLDHAQRFEMALDGRGMVPVGFRSSRLNKAQMSDLLEMIFQYAAEHEVILTDEVARDVA